MSNIKAVLWDVDGTLLDFRAAEREFFRRVVGRRHLFFHDHVEIMRQKTLHRRGGQNVGILFEKIAPIGRGMDGVPFRFEPLHRLPHRRARNAQLIRQLLARNAFPAPFFQYF